MSESSNKAEVSSLVVSVCLHVCFYVISNPLYFSCLLYFTPYIVKLFSFLAPIFLTCALLLLALLTSSTDQFYSELFDSQVGFLLSTYQLVQEQFSFNGVGEDEEFGNFVHLEAFKVMLETSIFEGLEPKFEADCSHVTEEGEQKAVLCSTQVNSNVNLLKASGANSNVNLFESDGDVEIIEVKTLQTMFKEETEVEDDRLEQTVQEVKPLDLKLNKVEVKKEKSSIKGGPILIERYKHTNSKEESCFYDSNGDHEDVGYACTASQRHEATVEKPSDNGKHRLKDMGSHNLGSSRSMGKEKEWRRTLACKLFEERHNVGGGEGMDMLWETYENESNKVQVKSNKTNGKKGEVECSDEDDEHVEGKLCCLQVLKFSAGKVNLVMGRPNLMKISRALKGIGWFHHVGKNGQKERR